MTRLTFSERLSKQRGLVGFMQMFPNPVMTELAGLCGYDFIVFDCEHGMFSEMDIVQSLQIVAGTDTAGIVRLRSNDSQGLQSLGRYLDLGADGILVPNVTTAEQARAAVRAAEYAPAGTRGFAATAHRVTGYGLDALSHIRDPRKGAFIAVLIESRAGISNVDSILAVDGIDAAIIGPSDLTADLGNVGDFSVPEFGAATTRVEQAAKAAGKIIGIPPGPDRPIDKLLDRGHRLFIIGSDVSLIREGMTNQVSKAKGSFGQGLPPRPQ